MVYVQPLTLLTSSSAKWTPAQEKAITRDYPFTDLHLETPDQFVVRTYLQFLWLPESIMPINLLVPSLKRVQDLSSSPPDTPHPLHALLDQLLLSVRSAAAKYTVELPKILVQDGGGGGIEESMMWFALNYEMGEGEEGGAGVNSEDAIMLEEKSRKMWLERLERREVQIQILLYFLKLSLPGTCTPLPAVTIPPSAIDVVPSTKKKRRKERAKVVIPSPHERLESFMDKLSMWQLVTTMKDADKSTGKTREERDWMQAFCEDVVERQFKSTLPGMCALLRSKLFPHSPFSDDDHDTDQRSSPAPHTADSTNPRHNKRKLARSSTSTSVSQSKSKPNPKPVQRSSSILSQTSASDARSRSRSLSVSLAQDASARRSNSASGTASSLKRALSREVSMSRGFKPRVQQSQASQVDGTGTRTKVLAKPKGEMRRVESKSQGVTLVAATPTKPRVKTDTKTQRYTSTESQGQIPSPNFSLNFDTHMEDEENGDHDPGDTESEGVPEIKDEDEELWLPTSSPDILLLGGRKRSASGSSSSFGFSDPGDEGGTETPVKKRQRI